MLETKQSIIGDHVYRVTMLPARKAIRVNHTIMSAIGPGLAEIWADSNGDMKNAITSSVIADAAKSFFLVATPDALLDICNQFAQETVYNTKDKEPGIVLGDRFDEHFAGDMLNLGKWFAFCVKVNFGNFGSLAEVQKGLG